MSHIRTLPAIVVLGVLALGCKTSRPYDRTNDPGGRALGTTTAGSLIISGRALAYDPGRTVLDVIRNAMPQMRITGYTEYTRCPQLELRGKDSMAGSNDPDVYVDGTRTTDTCPLIQIPAVQTERIEVYPLGMTARPGYPSSGHGLILIFLARADSGSDSSEVR
jgi:TonB-dependent Receptor Plug Domain